MNLIHLRRQCSGPCGLCRRASAAGAHIRAELASGPLASLNLAGDWDCPFGMGAIQGESKGLGDTVKKITTALRIAPCGSPCAERQATLNSLVPYQSANLPTKGQ